MKMLKAFLFLTMLMNVFLTTFIYVVSREPLMLIFIYFAMGPFVMHPYFFEPGWLFIESEGSRKKMVRAYVLWVVSFAEYRIYKWRLKRVHYLNKKINEPNFSPNSYEKIIIELLEHQRALEIFILKSKKIQEKSKKQI